MQEPCGKGSSESILASSLAGDIGSGGRLGAYAGGGWPRVRGHPRAHSPDRSQGPAQAPAPVALRQAQVTSRRPPVSVRGAFGARNTGLSLRSIAVTTSQNHGNSQDMKFHRSYIHSHAEDHAGQDSNPDRKSTR